MPITFKGFKSSGMNWSDRSIKGQDFTRVAGNQAMGIKGAGPSWEQVKAKKTGFHWTNPAERKKEDGIKQGGTRSHDPDSASRTPSRKFASAMIAKIPLPLSRHIARVYHP
jgi:hypothetical protein